MKLCVRMDTGSDKVIVFFFHVHAIILVFIMIHVQTERALSYPIHVEGKLFPAAICVMFRAKYLLSENK